MHDRQLYLMRDLESMPVKKLLAIIDMSPSITYGTVDADNGDHSYVVPKAQRATADSKLMDDLRTRLSLGSTEVMRKLTRDWDLERPAWLAMGNAVDRVLAAANQCLEWRKKPQITRVYIAPVLGELIAFSHLGILETRAEDNKLPSTFAELMAHLLDLSVRRGCVRPEPVHGEDRALIMDRASHVKPLPLLTTDTECDTPASYVRAIIKRENVLEETLVAFEASQVSRAQMLEARVARVLQYFPGAVNA